MINTRIIRIGGMVFRHIYLWRKSLSRFTDTFYWPVLSLLIWGYVSIYFINKGSPPNLIASLLGGLIFWTLIQRSQQDMSIGMLEDGWNRNLINIFATPITIWEYLIGLMVVAFIKMMAGFIVVGIVAFFLFHFNIYSFGIYLPLFILNLLLCGWWAGIVTNGLIIRYGYEMEALAWTIIFLLQPFSGVFYPISILPGWMQIIARLTPPSYIFEGLRALVFDGYFDWMLFGQSLGLNIIFIILTLLFYKRMFDSARDKGYLTKLF
ncbi:MAG: ABC-2 type transporter [Candidatus Gottesmanbacteria bacterium GW2011_GWA2_41_12]|uniref:Transport permease protein n=2 Tax=Candidatus Gottesmaniibacteriota TaxID=1752720 RepID=A0A0G0ULZ3_9BACT|nr:MAG: ABC-2 type transporter [Candidatus Gottesmanbacteria bacterium GW2011_GWC2_39_8]KKR88551.1 MAG: ABC-2 type transporter [Candidatus Gottesmanbacteria bacterium GW2011_GWA2_41_12]